MITRYLYLFLGADILDITAVIVYDIPDDRDDLSTSSPTACESGPPFYSFVLFASSVVLFASAVLFAPSCLVF
jgi:hypothetical protein